MQASILLLERMSAKAVESRSQEGPCREPSDIRPFDLMLLQGLEGEPELNGRAVIVACRDPGREGTWFVSVSVGTGTGEATREISVAAEKLFHIRPAA